MTDPKLSPEWKAWPLTEKLVQLAAYHCDALKVKEEPKGSNDGAWVRRYLAAAGVNFPAPWCASFVTYLAKECGYEHIPKHPAAVASWSHMPKAAEPARGDLFFYLHENGTGHIGVVLENKGATVRTIEGNTNDEGSREGFEVCRRERKISALRFIRL